MKKFSEFNRDEDREDLNELSSETLSNYAIKAGADRHKQLHRLHTKSDNGIDATRHFVKSQNRKFGVRKATEKLAKKTQVGVHEEEELSELSTGTLSSYVIKSSASKVKHEKKAGRADDTRRDAEHHAKIFKDKEPHFAASSAKGAKNASKIMKHHDKKAYNREKGGDRAVAKLSKKFPHIHEETIEELTQGKLKDYVRKADQSIEDMSGSMEKDNKHFKRTLYRNYAKSKVSESEQSNVLDNSSQELIERSGTDQFKHIVTRDTATKSPNVGHKHTQKQKAMYHTTRTQDAINWGFRKKSGKDSNLRSKDSDTLTQRFDAEKDTRLGSLKAQKKSKNIGESRHYLEARQAIHAAHAETGRQLAGKFSNPEIRQVHMHRATKHEHAARVLDILKSKMKK